MLDYKYLFSFNFLPGHIITMKKGVREFPVLRSISHSCCSSFAKVVFIELTDK
jgi:hypothetical protein